ncbi:hypothetical protein Tco_0580434 [Tanacetum coccineum]
MLNKKLQADYWNEMCYQLLKLMIQKMNIKFRGGLLGLKDFKMILRVTTAQVMHTYYARESHIPPPTIVPPSPILSPMFNPREFFLPEELLPLKKRGHDRSSSSTSDLPQAFEIGESYCKTSLERHKEQIKEILNHLDELSLDRIEYIEDKIKGLRNGWVIIQ